MLHYVVNLIPGSSRNWRVSPNSVVCECTQMPTSESKCNFYFKFIFSNCCMIPSESIFILLIETLEKCFNQGHNADYHLLNLTQLNFHFGNWGQPSLIIFYCHFIIPLLCIITTVIIFYIYKQINLGHL